MTIFSRDSASAPLSATFWALSLATLVVSPEVLACATCGCSLSPDGALGYSTTGGWGISVDDSFINQNQLRNGTSPISPQQVQTVTDQEVEHQTVNRYVTVGLSYTSDANWNFKLLLPYVDRSHSTYGTDATLPLTADQISSATASGLGDVRLIANYQGFLPSKNLGVQVGIKLPTGDYGGPSATNPDGGAGHGSVGRNPVVFGPSGNSGSSYLDTSLNVGNGSTDLILGGYYFQPVSQDFDAFVNGQYQFSVKQALNQSGADYRPGNNLNLSFGLRYEVNPDMVPQLQINLTNKKADSGALADTTDTAGTVAYLSPGVSLHAMKNTQVYAFVQVPIYSNLSGYQLFPRYTASAGVSYRF